MRILRASLLPLVVSAAAIDRRAAGTLATAGRSAGTKTGRDVAQAPPSRPAPGYFDTMVDTLTEISKVVVVMGGIYYGSTYVMSGINAMTNTMTQWMSDSLINATPYVLPKEKLFKVENLKPKLRRNSKRLRLLWGPRKLTPASNSYSLENFFLEPASTMFNAIVEALPLDSTILWVNTSLVFEDGRDAMISDGVYLHHWGLYDLDKTGKLINDCSGLTPARPQLLVGGAEDKGDNYFTTPDGTFNSGYYVGKDDRVMVTAYIVNYSKEPKEVYSMVELEYVPGKIPGAMDVSVTSMSVTGCDFDVNFEPPKNQSHAEEKSKRFVVQNDGYIISQKGHVHDGGTHVISRLNGTEICNSKAIYTADGTVVEGQEKKWDTIKQMTKCEKPVRVRKGDEITLESFYDFEKHPSREFVSGDKAHQMGIMFVTFASPRDDKKR